MYNGNEDYNEIIVLIDEINNIMQQHDKKLNSVNICFAYQKKKNIINNSCYELTFIYIVTFLYMLYYERGNTNSKYLIKKYSLFNIDKKRCEQHRENIQVLRTFYCHYLDTHKKSDQSKIKKTQMWYLSVLDKLQPENEQDWNKCCKELFTECRLHLNNLKLCMLKLFEISDPDIFIEWNSYITNKNIPKYKIESIVSETFDRFKLPLDINEFLKEYLNQIQQYLTYNNYNKFGGIDKYIVDRVEYILFGINLIPCPVSGQDIKEVFDADGKDVGTIKQTAVNIFNDDIYLTKDEIIFMLKEIYPNMIIDDSSNTQTEISK